MSHLNHKRRKPVLVIANPTAGRCRHDRLEQVLDALRDRACDPSLQTTSARGDAESFAANVDPERFDVIAIAGGDGTINEVLNGVGAASPPIAIIPLGTANVLAAEIGLAPTIRAITDTIAYGHPRHISLGLANERRFAVMASIGFDAEVVRGVSLDLKRYLGKGAYACEVLHRLLTYQPSSYQLSIDGIKHEAHAAIIANGRHYGGRFVVAPDARLEKPSFDICRCTRSGRLATLRYLTSMIRGRLPDRKDYKITPATSVRITGPKGAPVQADGDILTSLPATISIQPEAVELLFPPRQP